MKRVVFVILQVVLLLVVSEVGMRVYLFFKYDHQLKYLTAPLGWPKVEIRYKSRGTWTVRSEASGRLLTFTVNDQGGRGPNWVLPKPSGTVRLIAVGGSSTFGNTNPEDATWPVLLGNELRQRGIAAEVLNGGGPGRRIEDICHELETRMLRYNPDMVLFYEGFNNAILYRRARTNPDRAIGQLHSHKEWLRRSLYYRSMLYTHLVEKVLFMQARYSKTVGDELVPEIEFFQEQLQRFLQLLQAHHVTPVLILQVTSSPSEPSLADLRLDDHEAVKTFVLQTPAPAPTDRVLVRPLSETERLWTRQAHVLIEVVRRTGTAAGVSVIDPRPAFIHEAGTVPLFYDVVHLTDDGNQLLARAVADQLAPRLQRYAKSSGR